MEKKICAICKKQLGKYKWLGIPFYKSERAVCSECYKNQMEKINTKAEDLK